MAQYLMRQRARSALTTAVVLLPLAALLTVHPLLVHGNSCGHDMGFHMLSWVDAAHQMAHGTLYPHWTTPAAWNAGEPRFLFYPPLSWMLGALLVGAAHILHLPTSIAPMLYIWIALVASGFAMLHLARHFVSPPAALLAAALYLANPYMLFNAFERSAFAELLAAAWIPLLLLAVLRERPTIRGIAMPVALLWLTNAPAAVMGCYLFALLAALRVLSAAMNRGRSPFQEGSSRPKSALTGVPVGRSLPERGGRVDEVERPAAALPLAATCLCGTALGLTLPAFYLLPAAYERRFVQVAMAMIGNMRFQDGFLFDRTTDPGHNAVNHTVSVLAIVLLATALAVISALLLRKQRCVLSTEVSQFHGETEWRAGCRDPQLSFVTTALALLTVLIAFLLVPLSTPLWNHVPELAFLQFPWRLLTILSAVLGLAIALLVDNLSGATFMTRHSSGMGGMTISAALVLPLLLSAVGYHLYAQGCDPPDMPGFIDSIVASHHGVMPTDEYTPLHADNDVLRTGNPGYWLTATPAAQAPGTRPTEAELNPSLMNDDEDPPLSQTVSTPAPHHFQVHAPTRGYLILNLRDYPNWDITETDPNSMESYHPAHNTRDDGLTALTLWYPSDYSIDIRWRTTRDQMLGWAISGCGLLALGLTYLRRRAV